MRPLRRDGWKGPLSRMETSPASALRKPQAMEKAVVLPAPLGPIRPKSEPRGTSSDSPRRASMAPKRLRTSENRSAAMSEIPPAQQHEAGREVDRRQRQADRHVAGEGPSRRV